MRIGMLGALALVLAGTNPALAQSPSVVRLQGEDNAFDVGADRPIHDNAWDMDYPFDRSRPGVYFSGEYLYWFLSGDARLPVLATVNPTTAAPPILGLPTTEIDFGTDYPSPDALHGGRFTIGGYLDAFTDLPLGWEVQGLLIGGRSREFRLDSPSPGDFPLRGRPFTNAQTGLPDVFIYSEPNNVNGSFLYTHHDQFGSACASVLLPLGEPAWYPELLAGFRYTYLEGDIGIGTSSLDVTGNQLVFNGSPTASGDRVLVADYFRTKNHFYGGEVGARYTCTCGWFYMQLLGKAAAGYVRQEARIHGVSTLDQATGGRASLPGGLLAVASNSGQYERTRFTVVPELGITFGINVSENFRLTLGYSAIYWRNVLRPTDLIDTTVNVTQVPASPDFGPLVGPSRPSVTLRDRDLFIHGLTAGAAFSY